MKLKLWKSNKSVLVMTQSLLLLVAVALPTIQWHASSNQQWSGDLQQLQVQRWWLVRALDILKDHRHVAQSLSASDEANGEDDVKSIDSITLSLIEAIKLSARTEQLELTQLTVTQSDERQVEGDKNIHALRLMFTLNADRAISLLSLFDALRAAAKWRPIEVRGCSVVRLTAMPVRLQASCSVDIYYFPKVDK